MQLFKKTLPEDKLHKNYLSILKSTKKEDRDELLRWCKGFPDRDNKFVKEFQTTFNSSFWEVYLYALFQELQFPMNWEHASPDFHVETKSQELIIEATTASNTRGKKPEWERDLNFSDLPRKKFREVNRESIIRLSNAITSKNTKYQKKYQSLEHVVNKPFLLAVAPFEQPHFNIQYDVPITALLFDYYVDEDAYIENPDLYQNGPPGVSLGSVEKDNGSLIKLGFFENESFSDISAIIFSTTATWGKVEVMSKGSKFNRFVSSIWFEGKSNKLKYNSSKASQYTENIRDGLMVFHNPYAKFPVDPKIFKIDGVVQIFMDKITRKIDRQRNGNCLVNRQVNSLIMQV